MYRAQLFAICVFAPIFLGCRSTQDVPYSSCNPVNRSIRREVETTAPIRQVGLSWESENASGHHGLTTVLADSLEPRTLSSELPDEFFNLSLDQAIQMALQCSSVLDTLNARVLESPESLTTVWDRAILDAHPLYGFDGALSAFDTDFSTGMFWSKNARVFNNITAGQGVRQFQQDTGNFNLEVSKATETGSTLALRNRTDYDANNAVGNRFPSAYTSVFEAEARQPLLQGFGTQINRIVGPSNQPGYRLSNGVLLARANSKISSADFESRLTDFVQEIEVAYWELYFAYRELESRGEARDVARETWQQVKARFDRGVPGGEADKEAQARADSLRYEDIYDEALNGSTGKNNTPGVYNSERHLRTLLRMTNEQPLLIRPIDEPSMASVDFDWHATLAESLNRRVELRRQKCVVKKREMEYLAACNFLKPRLDVVGRYRWRGFGDDLLSSSGRQFDNALSNLFDGDFQEWDVGFEFDMPIGFRQANAAVRHAELQLARERGILHEQERRIAEDVATAISEVTRLYISCQRRTRRLEAAQDRSRAVKASFEAGEANSQVVLLATESLSAAKTAYHRALVDYQNAIHNVQRNRGSLLSDSGVFLNDGACPLAGFGNIEGAEVRSHASHPEPSVHQNNGADQEAIDPETTRQKAIPVDSAKELFLKPIELRPTNRTSGPPNTVVPLNE